MKILLLDNFRRETWRLRENKSIVTKKVAPHRYPDAVSNKVTCTCQIRRRVFQTIHDLHAHSMTILKHHTLIC